MGILMRFKALLAASGLAMAAASTTPALAQVVPAGKLASAAQAGRIAVPPLSFTSRTLPNGLKVYALRDTSTANVTVQMLYDVGAKDDPAGRSGFAHLFEHILSRVTRNIPHGELSRLVEEEAGGTRNASTSPDTTSYYETVPASQLEAMIWAHAERMGRSVLDQSVFDAERNIVKEEMRQRVLATPYGRLQRYILFENTFPTHPYARSGIGTMGDLDAASLDDARAFHENFYRPDNATLIISGNFDPALLNRWVDGHLGPIAKPSRPILRFNATVTPPTEPRTLMAYGPNVPLPALVYSWQRPKADHPDSAAFEVLTQVMSGGQSSRLYQSIVYEKQIATSANAINYGLEDAGLFAVFSLLASGRDMADLDAALTAEIARLRNTPVSNAELREAITEYVSGQLFDRETPSGRASALGSGIVNAGDPRWSDRMLAAVQKVTAQDVQRVARKYLSDNSRLTIQYLDESARQGEAGIDPSQRRTDDRYGMTLPPATSTPNTLAPEGERVAPPAPTAQQPMSPPAFAERTLANGMRVVVARSTDLPLTGAYLVFGGGAAADPENLPGVANMMASLVNKGTASLSATELSARIESLGARIGASAGADSTSAFVFAPSVNIEAAGRLLGEIVRHPAFAQAELERERRRSLDQLRVALRQPAFVNQLAVSRALYGDAPYGDPNGGTPASLAKLTREDLAGYHSRWWRPDNATLIVMGSLNAENGFALAERLFGDWKAPAGPHPELPANRAGPAQNPRVIVIDMPEADQAAVSVALRSISRTDSDYYPLLLANSVLGGSSTARLFQEVRVNRALSYGAYSSFQALRDEGPMVAQAQTRNDGVPEVVRVMLNEIRRLATEPVADDVLAKRKTLLSGSFGRQVETTSGLGGFLAGLAVQGLPMSEYTAYLSKLSAVTPAQVAASVSAELDPAQASIVVVGNANQFLDALRADYPKVEVIPFSEFDYGSASLRGAPKTP
jgi:zinc protease